MRPRFGTVRPVLLILVVAAAVIGLACGWLVATKFQSPAQIAAQSAPPPPSVVGTPVVEGDLGEEITLRASVQYSDQVHVRVSADAASVVTQANAPVGSEVTAGSVLVEINGSPVFAIEGAFPFYRDLRIGDSGPDVRMLQRALTAAGWSVDDDGRFGPQTAQAIKWLYDTHGYSAPTAPAPDNAEDAPSDQANNAEDLSADAEPAYSYLPLGAVAVTNSLPATLLEVPKVGLVPEEGASVALTSGTVQIIAAVTAETAAQLKLGMQAEILGAATEQLIEVADIAETVGEDGTVGVIFTAPTSLGSEAIGQEVVVSVSINGAQEPGWVVPTRAIITRAGATMVRRIREDGTVIEVRVREVGSNLGMSQIEPIEVDTLELGDEVLLE